MPNPHKHGHRKPPTKGHTDCNAARSAQLRAINAKSTAHSPTEEHAEDKHSRIHVNCSQQMLSTTHPPETHRTETQHAQRSRHSTFKTKDRKTQSVPTTKENNTLTKQRPRQTHRTNITHKLTHAHHNTGCTHTTPHAMQRMPTAQTTHTEHKTTHIARTAHITKRVIHAPISAPKVHAKQGHHAHTSRKRQHSTPYTLNKLRAVHKAYTQRKTQEASKETVNAQRSSSLHIH